MTSRQEQTLDNKKCDIPEWMNIGYFESILNSAYEHRKFEVQSISVEYALPKGENFISLVYRVQVLSNDVDQSLSFIVKFTPPDDVANTWLKDYEVHEKETIMYRRVIPKIQQLLREIGDEAQLYPLVLSIDQQRDVLVLEDLYQIGFRMTDRIQGLDLIHCRMVLELLAKQHAGSLKLLETNPKIFDRFNTCIVTRQTDAFYPNFQSSFDALIVEIRNWSQEWQYYANKLHNLAPHFVEQCLSVLDHENEDDLRVLVHGDSWTNNIMFKYDSTGSPVDVVLVDFQFCCYTTPAVDLCYFFITSTEDNIRQNSFEELMQHYYHHLVNYARRLRCSAKIPTFQRFRQQLSRKMFYAVYAAIVPLPVAIIERACDADLEGLTGAEQMRRFKRTIMANRNYHKAIKGLLPIFDRQGLLDKRK